MARTPNVELDLTQPIAGNDFLTAEATYDDTNFVNHAFSPSEFDSIPVSSPTDNLPSSQTNLFERDSLEKPNNYQTISPTNAFDHGHSDPRRNPFLSWVQHFKVNPFVFEIVISIVAALLVWLAGYVIIGSQNLPGGSVFVIILLEFGGRILGYVVTLVKIPPMVGMLGLGIAIRNIPYIDVGKHLDPEVSNPIRQISLAIILTRAGLGLDFNVLIRLKWIVARLAVCPSIVEATCTGVLLRYIVDFPWMWSILTGFVVAAVSPAVVVPRILALKEQGYGEDKGIATMILASASLDNTVVIALFGLILGFIFSNKSLTMNILQAPLEIIYGVGAGLLWGFFVGMIFLPAKKPNDYDTTSLKVLVLVGGCISCLLGFSHLGYSGAGALSCLISALTVSIIWHQRSVNVYDNETIKWNFTFLWKLMEPLLFGVIGTQIVISDLSSDVILKGSICLVVGAMIRFCTVLLIVSGTGLNLKEKLFVGISWVPKATVQAALGPMALHLAQTSGNKYEEELGLKVLTIAVLVILLTTPLGEMGVIMAGPKLLTKKKAESDSPTINGNQV